MQESGQNILFIILIALLFAVFLFFAIWLVRWQFGKADRLLQTWATENNYRILEKQKANFGDGPTGTRQSSSQVKYRVVVIGGNERKKTGLVTIGSKKLGTLSDEVTVEWGE